MGNIIYPLTIPVVWLKATSGALDEYGDPVASYTRQTIKVFAVTEGGAELFSENTPYRLRADLTVYAPTELGIGAMDRIEYEGQIYEVDGPPGCFDANPWWVPGLSVICASRVNAEATGKETGDHGAHSL